MKGKLQKGKSFERVCRNILAIDTASQANRDTEPDKVHAYARLVRRASRRQRTYRVTGRRRGRTRKKHAALPWSKKLKAWYDEKEDAGNNRDRSRLYSPGCFSV